MKVGDLVRNKNSESGELGIFLGMAIFRHALFESGHDYECAEVYWPERQKVGTIQIDLIVRSVDES